MTGLSPLLPAQQPAPFPLLSGRGRLHIAASCLPLPQGEAEATWVFMGWEGVEAARQGVELNVFRCGNGWSCVPLSQALLLTLGAIPACMRSQPLPAAAFCFFLCAGWETTGSLMATPPCCWHTLTS